MVESCFARRHFVKNWADFPVQARKSRKSARNDPESPAEWRRARAAAKETNIDDGQRD
jgi:hypothetical protein